MKKLPIGIQNFRKIKEGGYVYVDKTRYIYNLIDEASYFFCPGQGGLENRFC
ncbi:MAG: AAA family ATPase [Eubacteriaceae bacterium]|nr:AAA family ATPase [Eubacteriaceae bacterium]